MCQVANHTKINLFNYMSPFSLHLIILVWWLAGVNSNFPNPNLSFCFGFQGGRMSRIWNLECWYLEIETLLTTFIWIFQMLFIIAMPGESFIFYAGIPLSEAKNLQDLFGCSFVVSEDVLCCLQKRFVRNTYLVTS